ncbi:hypothetical protein HMPREF1986_02658 [Oribacterium sp. oral taxon 078 str. F0263]|nr:hypothetical protein HMPREF1986_02658 [Oribacterium sp. oral taxon 078 str. F0263]
MVSERLSARGGKRYRGVFWQRAGLRGRREAGESGGCRERE